MFDLTTRYPPTAHRRARARREGLLPISGAASRVAGLATGLLALALVGPVLVAELGRGLQRAATLVARPPGDPAAAADYLTGAWWGVAGLVLLVALAGAAGSVLAHLVQTGAWVGRARRSVLQWSQLWAGWSDGGPWGVGVRGLGLLAVAALVCWRSASPLLAALAGPRSATGILTGFGRLLGQACLGVLIGATLIAALDLLCQRWLHERGLWMTWEELRRELREQEGTARVRSAHKGAQP